MDVRSPDISAPAAPAAAGNGHGRFARPRWRAPSGRRRVGLALFAAFGLLGFTLGFALLARSSGAGRPAVALARTLAAGDALSPDDLADVEVGGEGVRALGRQEAEALVGAVALVALEEGTLLDPGFFAPRSALRPGEALVGVTVDPGAGPRRALRPGDPLLLVATRPPELASSESPAAPGAWWGEVFDAVPVETLEGLPGATAVSVKVAEGFAPSVADAAAAGRLRLVLVAETGPLDVPPAFVGLPGAEEASGGSADVDPVEEPAP